MRRRGIGVAAVSKKKLETAKFKEKGVEIAEDELSTMSQSFEKFRSHLETFAQKHRSEIKKNAEFRTHFQRMCSATGVDPLASSKGFWSELLGVGDFYYELAVQIVEVCLATRPTNGGLISLAELRGLLARGNRAEVSPDDVLRAIGKLKVLGSGFAVIQTGSEALVQSVPGELSMDHTTVLHMAQETGGFTTAGAVRDKLGWEPGRVDNVLEFMVKEGMVWVDKPDGKETKYWFPGMFHCI